MSTARVFVTGLPHSGTTVVTRMLAHAMGADLGDINGPGKGQGSEWLPLKMAVDRNENEVLPTDFFRGLAPAPQVFKLAAVPATAHNYHRFIEAFEVDHVVCTLRDQLTWVASIRLQGGPRRPDAELCERYDEHMHYLGQMVDRIHDQTHALVDFVSYPKVINDADHWSDRMMWLASDERLRAAHAEIADPKQVNRGFRG